MPAISLICRITSVPEAVAKVWEARAIIQARSVQPELGVLAHKLLVVRQELSTIQKH